MDRKSIWEVLLTPLTVAVVGVIGTYYISKAQLESSNAIAQGQQKIKIIEIFSDKITNDDHKQRELAINILTTLDAELGQGILIAIRDAGLDIPRTIDGMESSVAADVRAKISVQPNPNSKCLVGVYGVGVSNKEFKVVADKVRGSGYSVVAEHLLGTKPDWFSSHPVVFYYSDETKKKADQIRSELTNLTGQGFKIQRGRGLGVPKGQENVRFFVHYSQ